MQGFLYKVTNRVKLTITLLSCLIAAVACGKKMPVGSFKNDTALSKDGVPTLGGWRIGNPGDTKVAKTQFGIVAMGGSTDVDAAFRWMIERSGGGDFVVLRATGTAAYNSYIYQELGGVASVETLLIDSRSKAEDPAINKVLRNAEAVFIAGGNQADYVDHWKDTALIESLQWLIDEKKVPIGGTSSGCNVLGGIYFSASFGAIDSEQALGDPFHRRMDLGNRDLLKLPFLSNAILDSHLNNPDRMGRLVTFLGRAIADKMVPSHKEIFALGLDQRTAAAIDENGLAKIFSVGDTSNNYGYAYFVRANSAPERVQSRKSLDFYGDGRALSVYRARGYSDGRNSFSLKSWEGTGGEIFELAVDRGVLTADLVPDFVKSEEP